MGFKPANKKERQKQYYHTISAQCECSTNVPTRVELPATEIVNTFSYDSAKFQLGDT